jgi:3-phosphoshikimate 1-carboxyvinyltransferase
MKLPEILEIVPLEKPPRATIRIPGSKSITNRALILAALAHGTSTLGGALWADDTKIMVEALQKLGFNVKIREEPDEKSNRTIEVEGCGGEIPAKNAEIFVGNAGTAARFLTALVCLGHGEYKIFGDARMHERPMNDLFDALRPLGIEIECASGGKLPAKIRASGIKSGATVKISAEKSSQFASALLMIAPKARISVSLAEPDEPHGYVEMTRKMMLQFGLGAYGESGYKAQNYAVEPDASSASYFFAAGFLCGGDVKIADFPSRSLQMDANFVKFLPPKGKVSRLRDLGDAVLTLAVCAPFGNEPLVVTDAARLREQETDRIAAMVTELRKVGANARETADGFVVEPSENLHGAVIETYNDHRMAMAFSVFGLKMGGVRIKNPACVGKTFPNFFEKLEQLRR